MDNTFKELVSILQDGPKHILSDQSRVVFQNVFDVILSYTTQEEAWQYFSDEVLSIFIKYTGHNSSFNEVIYNIFINIFSEDILSRRLYASKDMDHIVKLSFENITDRNCKYADNACMFLSNITRLEKSCELILEYMAPFPETFNRLVTAFTTVSYNPKCSLDHLAMVFCNLSQLAKVRSILTQTESFILSKLIPFMNHENNTRRSGIVGVVRNCVFDSSIHHCLLSTEVGILTYLLLPLAGPEQFDDDDNDKLPIDLQYLPDTKTREPNAEIRKQLLETLNQLCATTFGRKYLRDHNAYVILRELHKWEEDPHVLLACENVVDILIRTEEEIGIDNIKTVDIPEDLEEKFSKILTP